MTLGRRALLAALVATPAVAQTSSLRDLARQAAIFLTPPYEMYKRRHRDVVERGDPLNRLIRQLAPQDGLLSATAWLDLSGEPMFLTLPAMADRFYSAVLLDPFARAAVEISHRTAGETPPSLVFVGPAFAGDTPAEARAIRTPSPSMWLRLRIASTDEDDDLDLARGLQARCLLETPDKRNERRILEMQELMRFRTYAPAEPVANWPEPRPAERVDVFDGGLAMLAGCVLGDRAQMELDAFAPLRIKPGRRFDLRAFSEAERTAILAGLGDAETAIREDGPRADDPLLHQAWRTKTTLAAPTAEEKP